MTYCPIEASIDEYLSREDYPSEDGDPEPAVTTPSTSWDNESDRRNAAFSYVEALMGGAGGFACDTKTWWGLA